MASSFHAGGAAEHERVLRAEHNERIRGLKDQLPDAGDDLQQQKIKEQVSEAEADFKAKLKQIRGSLF